MSFPFNSSFHPNGNEYYGTESNQLPPRQDLSDSTATLRYLDEYNLNGYDISDTMSLPSAALGSLPSSSQQPSTSFGGTATSDTSYPEPEPVPSAQDFPFPVTTGNTEQDFCFVGTFTGDSLDVPTGEILPNAPGENAASQPKIEQRFSEIWNEVPDVPTNDTHRGTAGPKILIEALDFIIADLNNPECTPAHASRTRKAKDALEELVKEHTSPGTESIVNAGGCLLCGVTFLNKGVLTRHFKDQHYPQFKFYCPKEGCSKTQNRKDKIQSHIRAHEGIDRESFTKTELPCPASCPICPLNTNSWEDFYACIIGHHKVGAQPPERAASRNSSVDHGQALQMGSAPTVDPPLCVSSQQLAVPGPDSVRRERSPSFNAVRSQNRSERMGIGRSHSDSQRAERNRLNSNSSRSTAHTGGQLRGRSPYPQSTQRNEIVRGRIFGQREPSSRNIRSLQCASCLRFFREFDPSEFGLMDRPRYCPRCFARCSFGSYTVPMEAQYSQQPQPPLQTAVSPPENFTYWTPEPFPTGQDTIQPFPTTQPNQGHRNARVPSRAAAFRSSPGSPPQSNEVNNLDIWAVRDIDSPTFSEEELSLCSPFSLGSSLSPASPLSSVFPWTKTLPIGLPTKPLKDLPTIPSSWLDNSFGISPWKDVPPAPRLSQCRCACNAKATKASSKMTTDLSSGRPVKVKLTVATNGPGSTLRNKVQIVVSLLNLRDTTKKKAEARKALKGAPNKADDDGDNDGDGDDEPDTKLPPLHFSHASSSIDTSLYDDQDIVPSDQPVVEFIFDLDTQASFDRISQLTSSMAPDLSDLDDTYDSESVEKLRLLWYFARYVVFMITVLGRAADEGFHPQLSD